MTTSELIEHGLTYSNAMIDYPFGEGENPVLRHIDNRKIFALFCTLDGRQAVNLKCDPMKADLLRNVYNDVIPGWHMNKVHWNTVFLEGDVPHDEILSMLNDSFEITTTKTKRNRSSVVKTDD